MAETSRGRNATGPAVVAVIVALVSPAPLAAQHFGANKVQYKRQDFRVLATEHFDIYFHQEDRTPADMAGVLAERWRVRFTRFFDHQLRGRQSLVLYNSHPDFEQTLVVDSFVEPGTRGVTEGWRRRMALSFIGPLGDTAHVIGHELVHAFQFDLMASEPSMQFKADAPMPPLWLIEGLAEYLTLDPHDPHTTMWLRDAAVADDLPRVDELDEPRRFPYRWGHALLAYIATRWSESTVAALYKTAVFHGVESAVERVLGMSLDELSDSWHGAIRETYANRLRLAEPVGRELIRERDFGGALNIAPSLSPDGRWLAFLSERAFFAIDLFVADATTGKVVRRLTDTAIDPDHPHLRFIDSSAAWARDGRRLAVAGVDEGRAAILIFRWPDGGRERPLVIQEVDEISGLTWAPDGRSIAFAGLRDGVTDLFVYDLQRRSLRRITHDAFADLQPVWSPDGRRLAFVTDRFTTDLTTLAFGAFRLAVVDVDGGVPQPIVALPAGKHINPQWSADGRSLYFVSDYDGVSDVYRLGVQDGTVGRLTRVATGISGVSPSSPAMSAASAAGRAAVVVFKRGAFAIHTLPLTDGGEVEGIADGPALNGGDHVPAVQDETTASPEIADAAARWPVTNYQPRLRFEGASQGSLTVGMDRFGATVGSAVGVAFSDILNTHRVSAAVRVNQGWGGGWNVANHALYGAYVNRSQRWNWGVIGSNLPMFSSVRSRVAIDESQTISTVSLVKQTERTGTVVASYALNRARRIEVQGGVGRLAFDRATFLKDGDVEWTTAAPALTFATASAALVGDSTSAGATSVVRGERYRFEVAPIFGTLRHVSVLADYRKYVMPLPFYTIATRAMHFGRYGKGAEDARLTPYYLGHPALVRGYRIDSTIVNECVVALAEGCREVDQLVGSRLAVGNIELRFPVLRPLGVSPRMYGPIPMEVALFLDAGVVSRQALARSDVRQWTSAWSTGVTLRANLIGLGLGQFDVARPFRNGRPEWVFQFNLVPAF